MLKIVDGLAIGLGAIGAVTGIIACHESRKTANALAQKIYEDDNDYGFIELEEEFRTLAREFYGTKNST